MPGVLVAQAQANVVEEVNVHILAFSEVFSFTYAVVMRKRGSKFVRVAENKDFASRTS